MAGRKLVESFAGNPERGGCQLSRTWTERGGSAEPRDILIDASHDFKEDVEFWEQEARSPADLYQFAPPCTTMSIAHTTPPLRSVEDPYGDASNPVVEEGNTFALLTVRRALEMLAVGAHVLIENPLMSFLWLLHEVQAMAGMVGMHLVRIDQCTVGTPYQKGQLWLTSVAELADEGATCSHPGPHPERLVGNKTRQSSPYPKRLTEKIVGAVGRSFESATAVPEHTRKVARYLLGHLFSVEGTRDGPLYADLRGAGADMVRAARHGRAAIAASEALDGFLNRQPIAAGAAPVDPETAFRTIDGNKSRYEREAIASLQRKDPDFGDVIEALAIKDTLECEDRYTEAELYKLLKVSLKVEGQGPSKRADQAIRLLPNYCLIDGLLHRELLDPKDNAFVQRVVVPSGGLRSFHYNGRQYRLSMRKSLLLLYHDSELIGAHPGVRDTLAKLSGQFWWPGMEHEVRRWVATCATCKLVKPTPALTAEQRMELHDRPFRVLFIDAIGPIRPADGEHKFLAHAECPYSRYPWIRPLREDCEEEWARFLVEDVFFDLAGFPAVLRSDRGSAFTGGVIKAVNTLLGVTHAFGSSYHPESQGYIEARHKPINNTLAAYARENPGHWAKRAKLAQWAMRATPRADRDGRSPFEIVTGLKPQGPLQRIFQNVTRDTLSPSAYIKDLTQHLQKVHESVRMYINADYDNKRFRAEGDKKSDWLPGVGDMVLVRRPPPAVLASQGQKAGTVSARLIPLADTRPFRVMKQVGPTAYVLQDPDTGSSELGFQQPVSLSRLIPFDMAALESPSNPDQELWVDVKSNKPGRDAQWLVRRIAGQSATGKVRLTSQDGSVTEMVDLASFEWRWRAVPKQRPQGAVLAMNAKYDPRVRNQNSPYAHPSAGDTAGWRPIIDSFVRGHAKHLAVRVDELLAKYSGKEKEYYDLLRRTHAGDARCQRPKVELTTGQCRICHEEGHWGNECPLKEHKLICGICQGEGHLAANCLPPWKRAKGGVPTVRRADATEDRSSRSSSSSQSRPPPWARPTATAAAAQRADTPQPQRPTKAARQLAQTQISLEASPAPLRRRTPIGMRSCESTYGRTSPGH